MALETPLHLKRCLLPHERHLVHLAVAGGAADAFIHVNAMIEINVLWQSVTRSHFNGRRSRQLSRTGAKMAAFVQICEWQVMQSWSEASREVGILGRGVAISAVDPQPAHVMLVLNGTG